MGADGRSDLVSTHSTIGKGSSVDHGTACSLCCPQDPAPTPVCLSQPLASLPVFAAVLVDLIGSSSVDSVWTSLPVIRSFCH